MLLALATHPWIVLLAALAALLAVGPLVRFLFTDVDTFLQETALNNHNRFLWLLGIGRIDGYVGFKILGLVAAYTLTAVALYQLICRFVG